MSETELLNGYIDILKRMVRLNEQLLRAIRSERAALRKANADEVKRRTGEKSELVEKIGVLEAERRAQSVPLAEIVGCEPEALTLSVLCEWTAEKRQGKEVRRISDKLRQLIHDVERANRENAGLMGHSLAIVREAIVLLERFRQPPQVYGRHGEVRDIGQSGHTLSSKA